MSWGSRKPSVGPLSLTQISMKDWKSYRKNFEEYINGLCFSGNYSYLSEEDKLIKLIRTIGQEWEEVYQTFSFDESNGGKTLAKALDKFEDYCKYPAYQTFIFNTRRQQPGETFNEYFDDLRQQIGHCDFGILKERMLISQIIVGIRDKTVQDDLSSAKGLSLTAVVQFCRLAETYRNKFSNDIELEEENGSL